MSDASEPPTGPAETRAVELVRLAASQTPGVSSRFTADLVARVRAQRALATPLRALGGLVAAIASAVAEAVRATREERRQ
jgi:hypothetical protein